MLMTAFTVFVLLLSVRCEKTEASSSHDNITVAKGPTVEVKVNVLDNETTSGGRDPEATKEPAVQNSSLGLHDIFGDGKEMDNSFREPGNSNFPHFISGDHSNINMKNSNSRDSPAFEELESHSVFPGDESRGLSKRIVISTGTGNTGSSGTVEERKSVSPDSVVHVSEHSETVRHSRLPEEWSPDLTVAPARGLVENGTGEGVRKGGVGNRRVPDEQRLLTRLMASYDHSVRPVFNISTSVMVNFSLTLVQIMDMDEKNQVLVTKVWLEHTWYDERIKWNSTDYNNLRILRIPTNKLWLPDIVLYNSADDFTAGYMPTNAMVHMDGMVFWAPPARLRSSCKVIVTYFPFDQQKCHLKFGSWTYEQGQVDIMIGRPLVDMSNYITNGEWFYVSSQIVRNEVQYPIGPAIYPDITVYVTIRRRTLYYVLNIILPCVSLNLLSLLAFCLPPDAGEKVTLGITVLLSYSVFMLLVAENMPPTSEFVPLIGIYLTLSMAVTSVSIVLTVWVLKLHHCNQYQKPVPVWLRHLILVRLARLISFKALPPSPRVGQGLGTSRSLVEKLRERSRRRLNGWGSWRMGRRQSDDRRRKMTDDNVESFMRIVREVSADGPPDVYVNSGQFVTSSWSRDTRDDAGGKEDKREEEEGEDLNPASTFRGRVPGERSNYYSSQSVTSSWSREARVRSVKLETETTEYLDEERRRRKEEDKILTASWPGGRVRNDINSSQAITSSSWCRDTVRSDMESVDKDDREGQALQLFQDGLIAKREVVKEIIGEMGDAVDYHVGLYEREKRDNVGLLLSCDHFDATRTNIFSQCRYNREDEMRGEVSPCREDEIKGEVRYYRENERIGKASCFSDDELKGDMATCYGRDNAMLNKSMPFSTKNGAEEITESKQKTPGEKMMRSKNSECRTEATSPSKREGARKPLPSGERTIPNERKCPNARDRAIMIEEMLRHLAIIIAKKDEDDRGMEIVDEWRHLASVIDRALFIVFLFTTTVITIVMMVIIPLTV